VGGKRMTAEEWNHWLSRIAPDYAGKRFPIGQEIIDGWRKQGMNDVDMKKMFIANEDAASTIRELRRQQRNPGLR